ncbi:hypothetical protein CYMTET_23599 [Cymbomonas tetramitiformis]|uniref:Threonylcarbamoyl-AMP synthase n=1 Tax=Cymbomonas tetramitiformis TaxID=36881 RepID=A0AAE0FXZ3_9CHLO|nr:hypothetical protein CYMTET_23599 [Cymbomonas tetramitiformis]
MTSGRVEFVQSKTNKRIDLGFCYPSAILKIPTFQTSSVPKITKHFQACWRLRTAEKELRAERTLHTPSLPYRYPFNSIYRGTQSSPVSSRLYGALAKMSAATEDHKRKRSETDDPSRSTSRAKASPLSATTENVPIAVKDLKSEQVIALPTDTLYGLGACASSAKAVEELYDIKGRNKNVPLAICVGRLADVGTYGDVTHLPAGLLDALLPGAVTLLLKRQTTPLLSESLNPGVLSIGIRIPAAEFICQVAAESGGALALTSANISGSTSTIDVKEFEPLWPKCAHVFDAGKLAAGRSGSTIVDLTISGRYTIIRDGDALVDTERILQEHGLQPPAECPELNVCEEGDNNGDEKRDDDKVVEKSDDDSKIGAK